MVLFYGSIRKLYKKGQDVVQAVGNVEFILKKSELCNKWKMVYGKMISSN